MMKGNHISIDIEACGEIVLSIGACNFNPTTGEQVGPPFYCVPSVTQQLAAGLRPDGDALLWLLKQSDGCREAIYRTQQHPIEAFNALREWWIDRESWAWAYPTSFDLPVIQRAMQAFGLQPPWKWTKTMDGRTLWRLACHMSPALEKIERESTPVEHHALEDARQQAKWYARYLVPIFKTED